MMITETRIYTYRCLPLILRVHKHTSRSAPLIAILGAIPLHTHISSCLQEIWLMMTDTYTPIHTHTRLIACTNTYFSFTLTGASLARMRRYPQLAYLFHQCATSLLCRDGSIADFTMTVTHPGAERQFSSFRMKDCPKETI